MVCGDKYVVIQIVVSLYVLWDFSLAACRISLPLTSGMLVIMGQGVVSLSSSSLGFTKPIECVNYVCTKFGEVLAIILFCSCTNLFLSSFDNSKDTNDTSDKPFELQVPEGLLIFLIFCSLLLILHNFY